MSDFGRPRWIPREEREWAAVPHAMLFLVIAGSFLIGELGQFLFLAALAATGWLAWRTRYMKSFAYRHVREALNFQITFIVVGLLALPAMTLGLWTRLDEGQPPWAVLIVSTVLLGGLALSGVGMVRASRGLDFRYPLCLRVVR
jgi:uncharacterized Tic20 family protein